MTDRTMTRRTAISGLAAGVMLPATAAVQPLRLVAGTYAGEGGKGLYGLTQAGGAGRWTVTPPIAGIDDASFMIRTDRGRWYALAARQEGMISAYAPGWRRTATIPSGGAGPCHLALDRAGRCLAIAHYGSGSVGFLPLDPRGGVTGAPIMFRHDGRGPQVDRQASAHAHWVGFSPDQRWLHAVDLGADAVFAYAFDAGARTLAPPQLAWRAPAGAGPRHLARHPHAPIAYIVCELSNQLVTLEVGVDGGFTTRSIVSTLPAGFAGASQAAHIAVDRAGRRLYVSNRGHDSIAIFAIDRAAMPIPIGHVPSGGHWPRFFVMLEDRRQTLVGNERSGTVAVFAIDDDGGLRDSGQRLTVPGVAFLGVA